MKPLFPQHSIAVIIIARLCAHRRPCDSASKAKGNDDSLIFFNTRIKVNHIDSSSFNLDLDGDSG